MYPPGEVAEKLGIKSSTLRKWSVEFAPFLSASARHAITMGGGASARRYSDHDVTVLERARALMMEYGTYDLARRALHDEFPRQVAAAAHDDSAGMVDEPELEDGDEDYSLGMPRNNTEEMVLALKALRASLEHAYSEAMAARDAQIEALSSAVDSQEQALTLQQQHIAELKSALERAHQEQTAQQQHISSLLVTLQRMAQKAPTAAPSAPSPRPTEPPPPPRRRRWWHRFFPQPEPSAPPPPPPKPSPPARSGSGEDDDLLSSLLSGETGRE